MTAKGSLVLQPGIPTQRTRPSDARRKVHHALRLIEQAVATVVSFAPFLPEYDDHHYAPDRSVCQGPDPKVVSLGLQQYSTYDPDETRATCDGWDGIYGGDTNHYIQCQGCEQLFTVPDTLK